MTKSIATAALTGLLAPAPPTRKSGIAMSLLDRLIPEGYEDSSGFHYGKMPPLDVLDTETSNERIFQSQSFKKINKATAHAA